MANQDDRYEELISYVAKALVDDPDAVEVAVVEADKAVIYELSVAPDDLGKVIGKDGRTARAMRTLLSASATGESRRPVLDILE